MRCLWDTDVLSAYLTGKNPTMRQRARAYLKQYGRAALSAMTRYEILRGLKAKNAHAQMTTFFAFVQRHDFLPLDLPVLDIASDVWASLSNTGQLIGDNDILIAATALHHGLPVATGNVAHFSRVPGLTVEDWTKP